MSEDQQSSEISVSAEITPTGFSATIKSRVASAIDRFVGAKFDRKAVPITSEIAEAKAVSDGRVAMIETLNEMAISRLKNDSEFANRAIENFLPTLLRRQENKDAVVDLALDDLRQNPPVEIDGSDSNQKLSDDFLDRFERFAEEASTDEVRERWARVLSAEIRKPNTFSRKVLRVIDELDSDTATLFEELCEKHSDGVIHKFLHREFSFSELINLVSAGLLVDPGATGQYRTCALVTDGAGNKFHLWGVGNFAVGLSCSPALPKKLRSETEMIVIGEEGPMIPIYVLTDVGRAVGSILPDRSQTIAGQLAERLNSVSPQSEIRIYRRENGGKTLVLSSRIMPQPDAT